MHRRSKHTSCSKRTGHIASILVLRVLAILTLPPYEEILPALALPALQNPEILEALGASTGAHTEILRVRPEVSAVAQNLGMLRVLAVFAVQTRNTASARSTDGNFLEHASLYSQG